MFELSAFSIAETLTAALKEIRIKNSYHTDAGLNVFHARQWFDFREIGKYPALSLFVTEESLIDFKGCSFKQALNIKVEGYIELNQIKTLYLLASDVKRVLLSQEYHFTLEYEGHEMNQPDEGSSIGSVQVKFKVTYLEQIMKGVNNG